jgi:IS1 transposase
MPGIDIAIFNPLQGDRFVPDENLKYAQLIKIKQGGRLKEIIKKTVFGEDIEADLISTSLIERLNLTLRQANNRISRKTIGFSKKIDDLRKQMNLYFANNNFCRGYRSLKQLGKIEICAPIRYFGLTNRNLTLKELLAIPCYKSRLFSSSRPI